MLCRHSGRPGARRRPPWRLGARRAGDRQCVRGWPAGPWRRAGCHAGAAWPGQRRAPKPVRAAAGPPGGSAPSGGRASQPRRLLSLRPPGSESSAPRPSGLAHRRAAGGNAPFRFNRGPSARGPVRKPQRARWIRGRHLHLELRCSFSLKGHGEGPGVSVLKGRTPPGERAPEDGHREPRPHGPACLRGRGRTEGCGLAGWARGQRPGLLTLRGTAERASGLGRHVARLSEAGLLRQRPGSRARRARWTPVGSARGPSSPWAKGLGRPRLLPDGRPGEAEIPSGLRHPV